jgi:hypothetical protein
MKESKKGSIAQNCIYVYLYFPKIEKLETRCKTAYDLIEWFCWKRFQLLDDATDEEWKEF